MAIVGTGLDLLVVGAILVVLNTFFVGLRLYTRVFVTKAVRFNDALLVIALVRIYASFASILSNSTPIGRLRSPLRSPCYGCPRRHWRKYLQRHRSRNHHLSQSNLFPGDHLRRPHLCHERQHRSHVYPPITLEGSDHPLLGFHCFGCTHQRSLHYLFARPMQAHQFCMEAAGPNNQGQVSTTHRTAVHGLRIEHCDGDS